MDQHTWRASPIGLNTETQVGEQALVNFSCTALSSNSGLNDYMAPWVVISESVDDEAAVVRHLQPLGVYQFRVTARNGFGLGPSSLISRLVQTNGRGQSLLSQQRDDWKAKSF